MKIIILLFSILALSSSMNAQEKRSVKEVEGLMVGDSATMFTALDMDSTIYNLEESLKDGPVVMIFYRGEWCPHCNKHLSIIQDSLSFIYEQGASVIAISPQNPEYLTKMEEKTGVSFKLLYDKNYVVANAYDVTFLPEKSQIFVYNGALGAKLKSSQSDDSQQLPIPATYIIGTDGLIKWRQFNPNYKKRSTVKEIVEQLTQISDGK